MTPIVTGTPFADREPLGTQQAIERGELVLADCRRKGSVALAREWETRYRSLRTHLAAAEF